MCKYRLVISVQTALGSAAGFRSMRHSNKDQATSSITYENRSRSDAVSGAACPRYLRCQAGSYVFHPGTYVGGSIRPWKWHGRGRWFDLDNGMHPRAFFASVFHSVAAELPKQRGYRSLCSVRMVSIVPRHYRGRGVHVLAKCVSTD